MRVLLIRPNSQIQVTQPPLGLGYIAEAIRRRGDAVEILDARNLRLKPKQVAEKIRDYKPDVVGISSLTPDARHSHQVAAIVKQEAPQAKVVIGGPYASTAMTRVLRDPNVDATVVGEGEETVVELLSAWEGGGDLSKVLGIVFRENGEARYTGPRPFITDLDDLWPAWDLIDPPKYFRRFARNSQNKIQKDYHSLPVFTSRGCPYQCIFCHNIFGKTFRPRSPQSVLDEIQMLKERYGIKELEILDDVFNMSRKRAMEICQGLLDRGIHLHIAFPNGMRGDRVDAEMLDLFKEAGIFRISFAGEAVSPRIQKLIKKNIDLDKLKESIALCAERKILTMGYFIMGFPTETYEEMLMTADYACDTELNMAMFFYLNPFPGTEVARMAGLDDDRLDHKGDLSDIVVNLSAATDEELHAANKYAYRKFYLNPKRIYRNLRVMPKNFALLWNIAFTSMFLIKDAVRM